MSTTTTRPFTNHGSSYLKETQSPSFPFLTSSRAQHADSPLSTSSSRFSSLTPAQRGRAASRAITFSLHDGNIADAYHIVNSIRLANSQAAFSFSAGSSPNTSITTSHFQTVANAFTPDVSPRLPSHTLLHELIRQRSVHRASLLAEQMMSSGMKVRTRSLEVLFASLAMASSPQAPSSSKTILPKDSMSRSLNIHPELISDTSTRFAVRLLLLARQSRQRRTHGMFKTLMALCLINGEIILASLIFGVLVRDWQKRVQLGQLQEDEEMDRQVDGPKAVRSTAIYDTPFPAWSHLNYMCEYIDESISAPDTDSESVVRYTASVQALANLAHLLDCRKLPIGGLTGLLQTMYKCPPGDVRVWVWEKKGEGGDDKRRRGHPTELEAQAYFKNVLKRLALRLPGPNKGSLRESAPAPLTLQTYNTLLHYSLAHIRARWIADKILHHMLYVDEGIEPSVVTMNILERAALRSRDKGINKQWVEGWRKRMSWRSGDVGSSKGGGDEVVDEISRAVSELLEIAARYRQNDPELVIINDNDNYTLSTRIAYLVARGRPEVVVDALSVLLPGTFHDSNISPTIGHQDSAIRRAVAYGPIVLTSMLAALMKTGRTGLAERLWEVMKEAEALSWVSFAQVADKGGGKVLSPWCLGVEAYTVMIMVYGKEARKGAGYGHGVDSGKHMVVGWGNRRRRKMSREQLGRQMGMKIYRMGLKEEATTRIKFERLWRDDGLRIRVVKNQLRLPQPDGHFFKAILDIVARRRGMRPRSQTTRRKARSRLMAKRKKYIWEGRVLGLSEPEVRLKEVALDMRLYGFQVPLLVERILFGRDY